MSLKVRVNEGSVEPEVCDDHSGRRRWWVLKIICGHDEHFACTRPGGMEREMDEWADGSESQLCADSIWQAATGKRVQDEWWRGQAYFTVSGLKWGKAWGCLHRLLSSVCTPSVCKHLKDEWSTAQSLKARHPLIRFHEHCMIFHSESLPNTSEVPQEKKNKEELLVCAALS